MTSWEETKSDGTTQPYNFRRLAFYPIILSKNLQMGFARIGKTQITYIRHGVEWNKELRIGQLRLNVGIKFPDYDTRRRNITINLRNASGDCEADLLFDGHAVRVINTKYSDHSPLFEQTLNLHLFSSEKEIGRFFSEFFEHFTFKILEIYDKSVPDYLGQNGYYRLSLIQYQENPFLVVSRYHRGWDTWNE